jgi:hypothetical protein
MGGAAWAAGLPANSVGSRQLKTNAVTQSKIAKESVTLAKIAPGSVTTTRLAKASVTRSRIAPGAVGADALDADAVTATRLAPNAVEPRNISPAAVAALLPAAFSARNPAIQQVGVTQVTLAQMTIKEPGRYFLSFVLRAFPRATNPGHNLNCSLVGTGVSGGPSFTNVFVSSTTGVQLIPTQSVATISAGPATLNLNCRQILGGGEVTATYEIAAIKVL